MEISQLLEKFFWQKTEKKKKKEDITEIACRKWYKLHAMGKTNLESEDKGNNCVPLTSFLS